MSKIAIVYFSGFGHTHLMAEAVAQGVKQGGGDVTLVRLDGKDISEGRYKNDNVFATIAGSDGVIWGSPTYMGGVAAQFKAFVDATGMIWMNRSWADKFAGGFTHSGGLSGDKLSTLQYLALFSAQHGMLWVSANDNGDGHINRIGSFTGVMGQTTPGSGQKSPELHPGDAETAVRYGTRFAQIVSGKK